MWKEEYKIGVELIDLQHYELFVKSEELLREVYKSSEFNKEKIIEMILFLKQYAVRHFEDEEKYSKSIKFEKYEEHKQQHADFIKRVLMYETKLIASDFVESDVQEFTGLLASWLVYHVSVSDQEINFGVKTEHLFNNYTDMVFNGVVKVLNKMVQIDESKIKKVGTFAESFDDATILKSKFTGDIMGSITFSFPNSLVKNLIYSMTKIEPEEIGILEVSILNQIVETVCSIICRYISLTKKIICKCNPPVIEKFFKSSGDEFIFIDTGIGILKIDTYFGNKSFFSSLK